MTSLTFYGGVNEIGGNKILLEDKGTKVFLDFGMQMGKVNQYFAEFLNPRILSGMGDLFEFDLLPQLKGLYRRDYSQHMGYSDDHNTDTEFHGVLLSHAHIDHCAYIHYLRPEIPIFCSEATKLILQSFQDMGSHEEYITYKENFKIYDNTRREKSRAKNEQNREERPRDIRLLEDYKKFKIDDIEIEPIPIDHSLPGVYGFLIHTSSGTAIGYTADIRFHGRRSADSQSFVDKCGSAKLDYLLCEGTRIHKDSSKTEQYVEESVKEIIDDSGQLVVCSYPGRDLDRLLSFYKSAKSAGRDLVIDIKQAYLLKLFQTSETWKNVFPSPTDDNIKIFLSKKSWGLIDKDPGIWTEKIIQADYNKWEREFLDYSNSVDFREVSLNQKNYVFYCSDFKLQDLIDIQPKENSTYIRSSTEPFNDEMILDQKRVQDWLIHFGLITNEEGWKAIHVSGHGSGDQIKKLVDGTSPKTLIPIHTKNEDHFDAIHDNVQKVTLNGSLTI